MINLNENYSIIGKDLNIILRSKRSINDATTLSENNDELDDKFKFGGYFSTISAIYSHIKKTNLLEESEIEEFKNTVENYNEAINSFSGIDSLLCATNKLKINVTPNWSVFINGEIFTLIKTEQIKESRFTKEENVGKDKYINYGYPRNLAYSLKSILENIVLDFLSKTEENTLADLNKEISEYLDFVSCLKIDELTDEQGIDDIENEFEEDNEFIEENI